MARSRDRMASHRKGTMIPLLRTFLLWRRDQIERRLVRMAREREKLNRSRAKVIQKLADLDQPLDYPVESR